jgi:hypothetical protein
MNSRENKFIYTWRGKNIETLTREQLLTALKDTFHCLERERKNHMRSIEMHEFLLKREIKFQIFARTHRNT